MVHAITNRCDRCDTCVPLCPVDAIQQGEDAYWIDPTLCNDCEGYSDQPICALSCPIESPIPWQAKKGRHKADSRPVTHPDLFINGKHHPFASAIIVWELCNVLSQRQSIPWQRQESGDFCYQRPIKQTHGHLSFQVTYTHKGDRAIPLQEAIGRGQIAALDLRAAGLHLLFAAYATTLETPWEEDFVIDDQQIEVYLGLDKRKDLSKLAKLTLIKTLVQQPCQFLATLDWPQQGRICAFSLEKSRLWHLQDTQHHFQEDELGCRHLVGITFRIRAGRWTQYFLNRQDCKDHTAFYQYGSLPRSLLSAMMGLWQQHEGAVRMMLWLLFKTKVGKEQRITVPTLMRVAYGADKVTQANLGREARKRLLHCFESDLEVLNHYGLKPIFDPVTYPVEIQPLWAKLADVPDDAEAALEFWTNDGTLAHRLTDSSPRGKWNRLMHARLLNFNLPSDWEPVTLKPEKKRATQSKARRNLQSPLDGQQIIAARKSLGWSQRELAQKTGKSQSWIRDLENGRFSAKSKDRSLLRKLLGADL